MLEGEAEEPPVDSGVRVTRPLDAVWRTVATLPHTTSNSSTASRLNDLLLAAPAVDTAGNE
jgi:hypothetical protein